MNILSFDEAIAKIVAVRYISLGRYLREQMAIWVADRQKTRWRPDLRFKIGCWFIKIGAHFLEDHS